GALAARAEGRERRGDRTRARKAQARASRRTQASDVRPLELRPQPASCAVERLQGRSRTTRGGRARSRSGKTRSLRAVRPLAPALAEAHALGEVGARRGVVRGDHGIVVRKAPLLAVFFRRKVVMRPQMPLE